ncbi:putative Ig domain-containing protein [Flavobacterium sp. 9AF]|uniref:putative Ig domain-containing protein n=1 Tax=Flavobacterium sp. 9AF TaxID=2653142 RepID=UPI00135CC78C|nr:putative Ig domain-containing protein [Flavobacterium sp. 9AF]
MKIKELLFLFYVANISYAQPPNISYNSPNNFNLYQSISPLLPTNSGGNIPNGPGITTYAGSGIQGDLNGNSNIAQFNFPTTCIFDSNNNLLVVDRGNHKIKKINSNGDVSTFAGTGTLGSLDGPLNVATFNFPTSVVEDSNGNFFICDQSNHKIRKIDSNGLISTFAGTGVGGFQDGVGNTAKFYYPDQIAIDNADNIYVADYYNNRIRKITPAGIVSTIAGGAIGDADGVGVLAKFKWPTGVCLDALGNIIVTDYGNHKIKKIETNGQVTTIAGSGLGDINGAALVAKFKNPTITALDNLGNIFVSDFGNHKIKKIDAFGNVTTFCGNGIVGNNDNELLLSTFNEPSAITFNQNGEMFIIDYANHKIRKTTSYDFNFSISPNLPNGLNFNIDTGEISGTPTVISPMTDYTVSISNQFGISSTIVSIEIANLSLNSFQKNQFKMFPNPFDTQVTLEFKNTFPSLIIFYNSLGQKVLSLKPTDLKLVIDLNDFKKGIYFVGLDFNSRIETIQLIKM